MKEQWDTMTNEQLVAEYQATNNEQLYEYFLQRNMGLIHKLLTPIIIRHSNQKDDLIQRGRSAMWRAMKRFDTTRITKFSTFLPYLIKDELRNHYFEQFSVAIPDYVIGDLENMMIKHPERIYYTESLNAVLRNDESYDESTLEQIIASDELTPEDETILNEDIEESAINQMLKYINELPLRTKELVKSYYGLDGYRKQNLRELSKEYNISHERVRQLIKQALVRLRRINKLPDVPDNKKVILKARKREYIKGEKRKIRNPETDKRFGPKPERQKPESKRSGQYVRKERPIKNAKTNE